MEDFREIIGFLIMGIGILFSVLKERKGKNSSGSTPPAQKPLIQRRPINHPVQAQRQVPSARTQAPTAATALPFTISPVTQRAAEHQAQEEELRRRRKPEPLEQTQSASTYEDLPEEGARVTQDIAPMESISDYNAQEEEEFIEKLREGIILSEILQRKF